MLFFILIIAAAAAAWWFLRSGDSDATKSVLKLKQRNDKQKSVIRYFLNDGCGKKRMKDAEYDALVGATVAGMDFKKRALDKIGIDEDELQEIAPVTFQGYKFGINCYQRQGDDNLWRSSCYEVTWLFFSSTQVYMYQYQLMLDCDEKRERTEEYFYKDITNFSTVSETEEVTVYEKGSDKPKLENIDTTQFALVVPGDKMFCAMTQSEDNERAVKAMKAKLREKKG